MKREPRNPGDHPPAGRPADGARGGDLEPDVRADLEALGAAWSALSQEQPPRPVDQAVLNAARRAVAPPASRLTRWSSSWPIRSLGVIATAAVVVLAVTVVIDLGEEAPVPGPPAGDGYRLERSVVAPKSVAESAAEADRNAVTAESHENRSTQQAPAQSLSAAAPADAEAWIERLRALKAAGDRARFDEALAAFRAAYPDYPVPPELLE